MTTSTLPRPEETYRHAGASYRPQHHERATTRQASPGSAEIPRNEILLGDAATVLATLPTGSVDCVVTSPPYFLLRNYGIDGQLGAESKVSEWVAALVLVMDEVARVLAPHGSVWLNLGDSFSRHPRFGARPKSLLLGPERLLLALADHGWIVRNKVVWAKPNPMPHSVRDRLSTTWEPIYLLVRSKEYFFDLDRIRVPHTSQAAPRRSHGPDKYIDNRPAWAGRFSGKNDGLARAKNEGRSGHPRGKNPGDVWTVPTSSYRGAHFATFPMRLVERPLLATCPQRVCVRCGTPWRRPVPSSRPIQACLCDAGWRPGLVLDPFIGAGTVAVAAKSHRRDWLGIELNPVYRKLALQRLAEL